MLSGELLAQAKQVAEGAARKAGEFTGAIGPAQDYITQHFGQNGLYAAYFLIAALVLFVLSKLVKLTISTLKYLVLPSVALAFIGSLFVPYSFPALLPATVTICSLILLFKG